MVEDVLEAAGYEVLQLGADVPATALSAMLARHRPAVTGLTCTCACDALVEAIASVETAGIATRIILGGDGVPAWLRRAGLPWLERSAGAADLVTSLLAEPAQRLPRPVLRVLARGSGDRSSRGGSPLTQRQTEILAGLAEGKSTAQIAAELVLAPVTIRNHVANILAALGVHSRLEAVVAARRMGLID